MNLSSVFFNIQLAYEVFVIWVLNHWRGLFTLLLCGILSVLGYFAHQAYKVSVEEEAHKAFLSVTRVVGAEVSAEAKKNPEKLLVAQQQKNEALLAAADLFLNQHSGSAYAPAVHGFIARAYESMDKHEEARNHFLAAKKACASTDLKNVYGLSVALMDLDSKDEGIRAQGVSELKDLCADESSSVCDAALFYLGEYFWKLQNYQEARLWWGQLIVSTNKKTTALGLTPKSSWASLAKERVALLDC
ncbi:tetratricopeptide repeat protein [Candidatus Dependentiae bacterium]|nr:tetratricopeptide repeat protein [Candidatus Dependentiae bacterium]